MSAWRCGVVLCCVGAVGSSCASDDETDPGAGGPPSAYDLCEQECVALHPAGQSEYQAFRRCLLCEACHDACASDAPSDLCGGEAELGCSAAASSCDECVTSACAAEQLADTTFAGHCAASAGACAAEIVCVQLNNCITDCMSG